MTAGCSALLWLGSASAYAGVCALKTQLRELAAQPFVGDAHQFWLGTDSFRRLFQAEKQLGDGRENLVVTGASGLGKSTLLQALARKNMDEGQPSHLIWAANLDTSSIERVRATFVKSIETPLDLPKDTLGRSTEGKRFIETGEIGPFLRMVRMRNLQEGKRPLLLLVDELQALFVPYPGYPQVHIGLEEGRSFIQSLLNQNELPVIGTLVELRGREKELKLLTDRVLQGSKAVRLQLRPESRATFRNWVRKVAMPSRDFVMTDDGIDALFEASGGSLGAADELLIAVPKEEPVNRSMFRDTLLGHVMNNAGSYGRFWPFRVIGERPGEIDWKSAWDLIQHQRGSRYEMTFDDPQATVRFFESQGVRISEETARRLLAAAQGSIGRLKIFVEQLNPRAKRITPEDVRTFESSELPQ